MLELLRGLKGVNLVGGDVVEVAPQYDATTNTAHAGAQVLFEILSLMVFSPFVYAQEEPEDMPARRPPASRVRQTKPTSSKGEQPMTYHSTFKSIRLCRRADAAPPSGSRPKPHADAIDDITKAGVINVGVFADFPPFSSASADMSLKGYDIDVAQDRRRAQGEAQPGRRHRPEPHPYLTEKRVDLLMSVGYSKEREEVIDFAAAYAPYYIAVIGPAALEVKARTTSPTSRSPSTAARWRTPR